MKSEEDRAAPKDGYYVAELAREKGVTTQAVRLWVRKKKIKAVWVIKPTEEGGGWAWWISKQNLAEFDALYKVSRGKITTYRKKRGGADGKRTRAAKRQ